MARGGKRPGAGRKPNKLKAQEAAAKAAPRHEINPFDPVVIEQARKLCELGATETEMADFFGVSTVTLYRWKLDCADFCNAVKAGKAEADERVERSLYHRAIGYTFDAVKIFMPAGAKSPVYAPYREHVPPDTVAAKHWLNNRRPEKWREKSEVVHKHDVSELTDAELAEIVQAGGGGGTAGPAGGSPGPDRVH